MGRDLTAAVTEIEQHAAARGWDQPPRLYALVRTAELLRQDPALGRQLGLPDDPAPESLTPVEQDPLPAEEPLDEVLSRIAWPDEVHGCALVVERLMLPPSAEDELPEPEEEDVGQWAAQRADREDVRLVVGVLRDGTRESALRMRSHDSAANVLSGADLVPGLAEALATTLT